MVPLRALLHLRPGESRRVLWIAIIGATYAAATSLGDDIAQAVFVARAGAEALPRMFLFKGVLDVAAAALYLPLARGRSADAVWRLSIAVYLASVAAGWGWARTGSVAGAYGLYVVHESAWTILTIHWTVLILEVFDANQARRLFPILFAATRLGGIGAGAVLGHLANRQGALDLLALTLALAAAAAALTWLAPAGAGHEPTSPERQSWLGLGREIMGSKLVQAIALSTAAMVLVRYGLRMVSMDEINIAYHHDEDLVAEFLGEFRVWANTVGAVLGIFVVPRLLTWLGVASMNLFYAIATLIAYAGLLALPNLATAAGARFVEQQLKDAAKTPLSALFYGAEPAHLRGAARAFMFGAVIPAATALTAVVFELSAKTGTLDVVAAIGTALAVAFVLSSQLLNRRWRARIGERLRAELAELDALPDVPEDLASALTDEIAADRTGLVEAAARALGSGSAPLAALGEEVLAETISRKKAQALAQFGRGPA